MEIIQKFHDIELNNTPKTRILNILNNPYIINACPYLVTWLRSLEKIIKFPIFYLELKIYSYNFDQLLQCTSLPIVIDYYEHCLFNSSAPLCEPEAPVPISRPVDCSAMVVDWTKTQVENWLNEKDVDSLIRGNLSPMSGKILAQLYEMQTVCPEFFYRSISSEHQVSTGKVAHFAYELKSLFRK